MNARLDDNADQIEDEFRSLLEGVRTTLPGVTVIGAFLLIMPLHERFQTLVHHERLAYYVAFVGALLSTLLLMAPPSHQQLRGEGGVARRHRRHLDVAVRITVVGAAAFAVSVTASAFLVLSLVLTTPLAVVVTAGLGAVCAWTWYYLPLVAFRRP